MANLSLSRDASQDALLASVAALLAGIWAMLRRRGSPSARAKLTVSVAAVLTLLWTCSRFTRRIRQSGAGGEPAAPDEPAAAAQPEPEPPAASRMDLVEATDSDVKATRIEDKGSTPRVRTSPTGKVFDLTAAIAEARDATFEEAAQPLMAVIPGLAKTIAACRALVKERRGQLPSVLTDDLACALVLYTDMEAGGHGSGNAYYRQLNTIQRTESWEQIPPFLMMLKLQVLALKELPSACADTGEDVWRGVQLNLEKDFPQGSYFTWWPFTSSTRRMEMLEEDTFLGKQGERTLFMIRLLIGFDIKVFSFFPGQDEVLMPPGLRFQVVGRMNLGHGLSIIRVQQVESPACVLNLSNWTAARGAFHAVHSMKSGAKAGMLVQKVDKRVGPKPTDRTWRDEWRAMYSEDRVAHKKAECTAESVGPGGSDSIEVKLKGKQKQIEWQLEHSKGSWGTEDAQAFTAIRSYCAQPLARALHEKSSEYAASTHLVCDLFARLARSRPTAPKTYVNLTGKYGIATQFDEWKQLLLADESKPSLAGLSFQTFSMCTSYSSQEVLAADGSGFCRPVYQPEKKQVEFVLQQDADVVEFVSSPIDAIGTLHSMVCISEDGRYVLPPMTTVTVEEVFAPGAWTSAAEAVMECWMISCSVNYSV